jgi:hypothetical protein
MRSLAAHDVPDGRDLSHLAIIDLSGTIGQ